MTISRLMAATALASASLIFCGSALAQSAQQLAQDPTAEDDQLAPESEEQAAGPEQIIVTGSRISRPEVTGVLPGVQVGQEQIQTRGFTNAIDIINDIPLTGTGANLNGTNGLGQPTSLGLAFVDLLDLGTTRTLTLINGRRVVSGNTATLFAFANETGAQVDLNNIPTQLIDRVDVVTVGGAAAYGADAIAGVVNFVLRDDYDGTSLTAIGNVTDRGDGFGYNLRALHGMNFDNDRGNIVLNFEYSHIDEVYGGRDFIDNQPSFVTSYNNGGIRNPNFQPALGGTSTPFLPVASDGASGNLGLGFTRNLGVSFGGNIFDTLATLPAQNRVASAPGSQTLLATTTTQVVPGTTVSAAAAGCSLTNSLFCNFAPSALPGNAAAQATFAQAVLASLSPANVAAGTQAERNTLALRLLQANRPTPREFFSANPNVPVSAFLGQFVGNFVDVANPNTTPVTIAGQTVPMNQILPRVAVPLQFDTAGNVIAIDPGTLQPTTPATVGLMPAPAGFYDGRAAAGAGIPTQPLLRPRQDRYLANLIGRWELFDGITLFTENSYSNVEAVVPRVLATANTVNTTAAETAALILNVNNPYLDVADRAALATYGITAGNARNGNFVLSRVNQDILGDNPSVNKTETFRTVTGFRGGFDLFGQDHQWEVAGSYAKTDLTLTAASLLDVEFSLAVDAVDEGEFLTGTPNGVIRCRSQLDPTAAQNLSGIQPNIIRTIGPDGLPTEVVFTPTATAQQISACQPLNPFGVNNMSDASKQYVRGLQRTDNESTQLFFDFQLSGGLFNLPGGTLQYALSGQWRKEELSIVQDTAQQEGRTRNAPTAPTEGELTTLEGGAEINLPIFGEDFTLPGFHSLTFNPAVRFVRQRGSSPSFRNVSGQVIDPEYRGSWETIYSLAGTWQPIRDITVRGNYTRSIRQPNIVELFLTNQSAFAATLDPCSNQRISLAADPTRRRSNCAALVVAAGVRPDLAEANAFLDTFVSTDLNQPVAFAGNNGLRPEKGESWTAGAILAPRFLPRFSLSADYINLKLNNQIIPTNPTQAAGFCVDSPTFPDTTPQFGSNLCNFIPRSSTTFQVQPGAAGQYLNLSATELEGVNISALYTFDLSPSLGALTLRSNAFHLIKYDTSATGQFNDTQRSAGSFARPKWEAVSSIRWDVSEYFTQLTHRFQSKTKIFSGGVPATIEFADFFEYPELHQFDLTLGAELESGLRFQFLVTNLTDETYAGNAGLFNGAYFDLLGRRYQMQIGFDF